MSVTKQSGKNTVAIAEAVRAEIDRINQSSAVHLTLLDDQSKFITRAITSVTEHAYLGAILADFRRVLL